MARREGTGFMFDRTIQVGMCAAPAGLGNISSCVGESQEAFLGSVSPLLFFFFFFLLFPDLESLRQVSCRLCLSDKRTVSQNVVHAA